MAEILRAALAQRIPFEPEQPRPLLRPVDEPEPYPDEALAGLRSAAVAIQAHTKAPLAICAQAVLGAAAIVAQGHANVMLPIGQTRPLSIYLLTIASSGERKTGVDVLALKPVYEREDELRQSYDQDMIAFDVAHDIWEAKRKEAKAGMKASRRQRGDHAYDAEADLRALGPAPDAPLTPIIVCGEPTYEGYVKLTAVGQASMGLFSAEGGGFIGGYGMSQDNRLKTAAGLSCIWDGDPIKRVRAGDGSIVLAGRRLSVHLMAQPAVAAQLLDDGLLTNQGMLARFLTVAPETTAGTRFFESAPDAARRELQRYNEHLSRLLRQPLPLRSGTRNELSPRTLRLSHGAERIWIGLHDHIERELGQYGAFAAIPGLANKAAEHAARLAGVLTIWTDIEAYEIDGDVMAHAVNLIQHYLAESIRLRGMALANRHLMLVGRVWNWLNEKYDEPAIYAAVIYNECTIREVRDRRTALRVIATLVEHGYLHALGDKIRIRGSLRNKAWRIHGRTLG